MGKTGQVSSEKVNPGKLIAWNLRPISLGAVTIIIGYLSLYCTDMLEMSPALVGTLVMVSKIFDGVTDLLAGWLVDNTHTKLGKARPYELCLVGVWICMYALFAANVEWSMTMKAVWVFILYTLIWSIFATMLNAAETPYLIRAFGDPIAITKVSAYGGILISVGCMIVSVTFPLMIAKWGADLAGWRKILAMYSVPLFLIGIVRFLTIKEVFAPKTAQEETRVSIKDIITAIRSNRYIWLLGICAMVPQMITGMAAGTYYYSNVVGDVSKYGMMQMVGMLAIVVCLFFPRLMKKYSCMRLTAACALVGIIGYVVNFFAGTNLALLGGAFLFTGIAGLPMSYMRTPVIMEIATYNESKNLPRMEASISAACNFLIKLGQALGAFLLGVMLSAGGYNGKLDVQPEGAIMMIRICYSLLPAALTALVVICALSFRPLDQFIAQRKQAETKA